MSGLSDAVVAWAAARSDGAESLVRQLVDETRPRAVALVEGVSDRAAFERLADRRGRDLDADGVCVVPMGGATSIGRFLELLGPGGLDVRVLGLCDFNEREYVERALKRAGLGTDGFYVCDADLEYELIRAVGRVGVEKVIEAEGDLLALRTFQRQPAQRVRSTEHQLHRFFGTIGGRKARYAAALVDAVDLDRVPKPLDELLSDA